MLIEAWEELEDIKAYNTAKLKKTDPIEAQIAFEEVENYIRSKKIKKCFTKSSSNGQLLSI